MYTETAQRRRTRVSPWTETRTKLSHQITSQESGAPKHRGNLSGDRASTWGTILNGRLLAGVFAGHNVMVASLRRERVVGLRVWEVGHELTLSGLLVRRCNFEGADCIAQ